MNFDEIGPRPCLEMLAKSDSAANIRRQSKSCPSPDARFATIGADDPSARHISSGYLYTRAADAGDRLAPSGNDPNISSANRQQAMQVGAPKTDAIAYGSGKRGFS